MLDAEIAFRQSPVFEPLVAQERLRRFPGNLLEFPRQLVAAKKARPRLAEGPLLLEEAIRNPQLRIFEVEPVARCAGGIRAGGDGVELDPAGCAHGDRG